MAFEQGFTVNQIGNWPHETYQIKPVIGSPNGNFFVYSSIASYSYESETYFLNNPSIRINEIENNYITKNSITEDKREDGIFIAWLNSNSNFSVNSKQIRNDKFGNFCHYFKMNGEGASNIYSFAHYPRKLFLMPVSAQKINSSTFILTTSAVTISPQTYFFNENVPKDSRYIPNTYYDYINNTKTLNNISNTNSDLVTFFYDICASQTFVKRNFLTYGNTFETNPFIKVFNLKDFNCVSKIRHDSIYQEGSYNYFVFDDPPGDEPPGFYFQDLVYKYYQDFEAPEPFTAAVIMYYAPLVDENIQTFSFLNTSNNVQTFNFSYNSALSSVFDLRAGNARYNMKKSTNSVSTFQNFLSGTAGTNLTFSYIQDSDTFKNNLKVNDTLNSIYIHGTPSFTINDVLNKGVYSDKSYNDTVTFSTKYPPYYYSYNVSITSSQLTNKTDNHNLSFYLSTFPTTNTELPFFSATTFVYSDFNYLKLPIKDFAIDNEYIKYETETPNINLLEDIRIYYIEDGVRKLYNIVDSPWIKAKHGAEIEVHNPLTFSGYPLLTLRPKLSTLAGFKDARYVSKLTLKGLFSSPKYPMIVQTIKEGNDFIDITAEYMTGENASGITLDDSLIKWDFSPYNQNVKLVSLIKNANGTYSEGSLITPNTLVNYNQNTWAIRLSGYGGQQTNITFYSVKQDDQVVIPTDKYYYDAFSDNTLQITPKVDLDNLNQIRTIELQVKVPYNGRIVNLPDDTNIYWDWTYNNTYNNTTPITAYLENGEIYSGFDVKKAISLSSIKLEIKPITSDNFYTNTVTVNCYTVDTINLLKTSYTISPSPDNYPSENVVSQKLKVSYNGFENDILLDTDKKQNVLTRGNAVDNVYKIKTTFTGTSPTSITWRVDRSDGTFTETTNNNTEYVYTANKNILKHDVKCTLNGVYTSDWTSEYKHNIQKNITLYNLPQDQFDKELKFITYPEYAWKNSDQVSILDSSNYNTIAAGTTAYAYKKTNTEVFYVSSNVNFDRYIYSQGSGKQLLLDTNDDGINRLILNYSDEFFSSVGTILYLSAFNEYFPANTPLFYKNLENGTLVTKKYNITSETIPYNINTPVNSLFYQNPKLVDYNTITCTFNPIITVYDLDINRNIVVRQKFDTNPLNTPAKIQSQNSTITYTLSAPKWIVTKDIPAIDGTFNLFTIKPGDDLSPLRVKNTSINTLYLNASSDLNIKIPQSTFDTVNSGNQGLLLGGDLWDTKNIKIAQSSNWQTLQAYTTSTTPEIFLNTKNVLSGNQVFVEFLTPEYSTNPIISYAVDFGQGDIQIKTKNEKFFNTYFDLGTYYISYSAIYQDSKIKTFIGKTPFVVKQFWEEYDSLNTRVVDEQLLQLPYDLEDISIQPNEFGDVDIFNTSLKRVDENLNFLKNNIQTINTNSPSYYYGWMGSNRDNRTDGIRWYTETYGSEFYETPNYTTAEGTSFFTKIKDIYVGKYIYVLDDKKFRVFKTDKNCEEIIFSNSDGDDLFFDPKSIALSEDELSIYVADPIKHKIFRFDFDYDDANHPIYTQVLALGTLGALNDNNKFDFPSEIFYWNEKIHVLDYNNNCIKVYSGSLSWIHTYYDDVLQDDQIVNFTVHNTNLLYVATKNLKIHIFDEYAENVFSTFEIKELGESEIVKITFDGDGEFLYVITRENVFKYSNVGEYISVFNLPNILGLNFTSSKFGSNKELYVSTDTSILKFQDFVELFKIGDGLETKYWSLDQILLKKEEFATDVNYNLALNRTAQNLKTFNNSLNAKFVLVSEQTKKGTATYFSLIPISKEEKTYLETDVENEELKIGINEFYTPSVVNRELKKIYDSQVKIKEKLDVSITDTTISNLEGQNSICGGDFCWSWKSMSCYDLSLPLIRLCNINPITYAELMDTFPVNYAPTKQWKDATSNCCNEYTSPINI